MPTPILKKLTLVRTYKFFLYVSLFVFTYGLFLASSLPATYVFPPSVLQSNQIEASQIKGTIWSGNLSAEVRWDAWRITKMRWDFNPWALLSGVWEYRIEFALNDTPVKARLVKTWGNSWQLYHVVANTKLQEIPYLTQYLPLGAQTHLQGDLAIQLQKVSFANFLPKTIQGDFVLQSLKIGDLPNLGQWEGQINKTKDQMILTFKPQGEILEGKGRWTFSTNSQWLLSLQVKLGASKNHTLSTWLNLLGKPSSDGYHHIQQSGRLK